MKTQKIATPKPANDESHKQSIGRRIKRLRIQQTRTQSEIAAAAGLTKSMLSKIESGTAYPSVAAMARIAAALGAGVSALMEQSADDHRPVFVPRAKAEANITRSEKGYLVHPYATEFSEKKMQPFLFIAKRGEVKKHSLSHPGEEFVCVLEGEILFTVGDTQFRMRAGDTLFFNALDEHGVMPVTETAKYIDVFV